MSFENFEKETKKAESLVERMVCFARLKGLYLEEKPFSISLVTIDGRLFTLYKTPGLLNCGDRIEVVYGQIYKRHGIWEYITEPAAEFIYKLLEEKITELENKEQNKED